MSGLLASWHRMMRTFTFSVQIRLDASNPLYLRVPLWHLEAHPSFSHSIHSRIPPQSRALPAAALTSLNLCEGGSNRLAVKIHEQCPRPPLTYTLPPPAIATLKREREHLLPCCALNASLAALDCLALLSTAACIHRIVSASRS